MKANVINDISYEDNIVNPNDLIADSSDDLVSLNEIEVWKFFVHAQDSVTMVLCSVFCASQRRAPTTMQTNDVFILALFSSVLIGFAEVLLVCRSCCSTSCAGQDPAFCSLGLLVNGPSNELSCTASKISTAPSATPSTCHPH